MPRCPWPCPCLVCALLPCNRACTHSSTPFIDIDHSAVHGRANTPSLAGCWMMQAHAGSYCRKVHPPVHPDVAIPDLLKSANRSMLLQQMHCHCPSRCTRSHVAEHSAPAPGQPPLNTTPPCTSHGHNKTNDPPTPLVGHTQIMCRYACAQAAMRPTARQPPARLDLGWLVTRELFIGGLPCLPCPAQTGCPCRPG